MIELVSELTLKISLTFREMHNYENHRGARHRTMILMYITWLTLSLAPAMVAPPEKGFAQGQPEMQQAMDNMVAYKTIIKKRMPGPISDKTDFQATLSSKTSNLLSEAEQMLSKLPESKERQWIQAFVTRMRAIATMLEKTAQKKNENLTKNLNTVSGTPVPEGLPLQPTWPVTSAVPGINPFQKPNRMMSKFSVTSPELSKVLPPNEYPAERQVVTKPAVLSNKEAEDDELVRELENLHQEYAQHTSVENSKVLDQLPVFTTPSTPMSLESSSSNVINVEEEKAKLQSRLIQEMKEFEHLGGVLPSGILNALYTDNPKETGLVYNQKESMEDKLKYTEAGMVDRQGIQKFGENYMSENNEIPEEKLQNSVLEKNIPYQAEKQLQHTKYNSSFQNINPNFRHIRPDPRQTGNPFHYVSPQNRIPYQGNFGNAIQGLQNPYIQGKYNPMIAPIKQQPGHIPDALKQMMSRPQNNFYNNHLPFGYNEYLMRHNFGAYPYIQNFDPKNSTLNLAPMMPPYSPKQKINQQTNMQLSDEMKRQLRDGKIIVLSDSVVHTNFESNKVENTTDISRNEPKSKNMNEKNVIIHKK